MHPKAALLALHGAVALRFHHNIFQAGEPRVQWASRKTAGPQLSYSSGGWRVDLSSMTASYTEVPWDDLGDAVFDQLDDDLLARFVKTC